MKAQELRIGNYHLYHIVDKFNDPQEWDVIEQIDAQDLVYLSTPKGEKDEDYKPVTISREKLVQFGFSKDNENDYWIEYGKHPEIHMYFDLYFDTDKDGAKCYIPNYDVEIRTIHHLQNVFYVLTGKELILKQ